MDGWFFFRLSVNGCKSLSKLNTVKSTFSKINQTMFEFDVMHCWSEQRVIRKRSSWLWHGFPHPSQTNVCHCVCVSQCSSDARESQCNTASCLTCLCESTNQQGEISYGCMSGLDRTSLTGHPWHRVECLTCSHPLPATLTDTDTCSTCTHARTQLSIDHLIDFRLLLTEAVNQDVAFVFTAYTD